MVNSSNVATTTTVVPTSILQLQSQSPFLTNAMTNNATTTTTGKVLVSHNNNNMNASQQQQHQQQFTMPAASPKSMGGGATTVLQNIQLQASPVCASGNVSPQTGGMSGAAAAMMQGSGQATGTTTTLNLQGLNLASLQGAMATIPGLQNVQVSEPERVVECDLMWHV